MPKKFSNTLSIEPEKNTAMQRAALYIRVSTEEQALHGYSLEAQRETLTRYAKEHHLFIVDYYIDEGKSARKKYTNRKEFMRMMSDVEADKIDLILFIKLDRWFRSVKDYYKIQEILEAHNVDWKTTEEHYDTTTTNGRLYINIRLSVAQDESDRDSDRIKFVFDSKIARGEVISGSFPMGFKIENKHLVHDLSTVDIVRDLFRHYELHHSKSGTARYAREKYGISITYNIFNHMLNNPLYKGEYRGISDYCEPIIEPSLFDKLQQISKSRNVRTPPTKRFYIFSSLVICAECGHKMVGRFSSSGPNEYYHYRCNHAINVGNCLHRKTINEKEIEKWLLENIENEINHYIVEYKAQTAKRQKPLTDRAAIKRKLSRLKDLYVNDLISMETYKADYDLYTAQLAETSIPEAPSVNFQALQDFLCSDFKAIYIELSREKKRSLWRSIVKQIHIDAQNHITVSFA